MTNYQFLQRLKATRSFNIFLYYLQRLPLIGKHIPNRWFEAKYVKRLITWLGTVGEVFKQIFGKAFYFGAIFLLGFIGGPGQENTVRLLAIFCFSLVLATFWVKLIDPNQTFDRLCIYYLKMNPKSYYLNMTFMAGVNFVIFYGLAATIALKGMGLSLFSGMNMTLFFLGLRLLAQALYLKLVNPKRQVPNRPFTVLMIVMIFVAGALFVGLVILGDAGIWHLPINWLFQPLTALAGVVMAGLGAYSLQKSDKYQALARSSINHDSIHHINQAVTEAQSANVKVEGEDIKRPATSDKYDHLQGMSYINAIFFDRLGHKLNRRRRIIFMIVLAIFVLISGGIFIYQFFFQGDLGISQADLEEAYQTYLVVMVIYACLFLNIGESFTRFCFFNMDRYLMHNNYYRNPDLLAEAMVIRFKRCFGYNLPTLLVLMLGSSLVYFQLGGQRLLPLGILLLSQVVVMVFFTVHYLYLYYWLQPFTANLESKSPLYNIIRSLSIFIPYLLFMNAESIGPRVILGIYLFIVAYIILGYLLLKFIGPKRFVLR
ncbi:MULTISPECIES: hypothetical protein [Aerococcus]|uniref:Uncharacterized protein n=1 Tax=Aerococcus sanguinicola TaxID=119206 RepID=A0A5N1GIJ4_9LACT|nr:MULTISPECIES: hypothetical protein [Aerococcus]KAA9300224.1 hypothetical protein F6I03_08685 [Aerococcus sanguinicola]MDK6369570.1 hypothetical protein [Aerococcus sp. UMB9870]MDK6680058.1 hypothetical protein [Aerococcus sp. UMB8608]MDK6686061.1 hypothetical protein [Aerococcus sp. UMB8623]MDK6939841.1 hypothetical protein [Aerococcus sp. UMB8487]